MGDTELNCAVEFACTDQFGQETRVKKTLSREDGLTFDVLIEEFKLFLLAAGFSPENVEKIIVDED